MTRDPEGNLRDRIADVYAAFDRYRLPKQMTPDPLFPSKCDERPLRERPLSYLPPEAFETYQWKAVSTWGSVEDFKHFLPRMLELVALPASLSEPDSVVESWLLFGRLRYTEWQTWPDRERRSLEAYFAALWMALLHRPVDVSENAWRFKSLTDWLGEFADAHDDLSSFLQQWFDLIADTEHGQAPAAHLANSIFRVHEHLLKKGTLYWTGMANGAAAQGQQVMAWLASEAVFGALEAAFFRWPGPPYGQLLSEGHNWLDWWRQTRSVMAGQQSKR